MLKGKYNILPYFVHFILFVVITNSGVANIRKPLNIFDDAPKSEINLKTIGTNEASKEYIFNGSDSYIELEQSFDSTFTFCAWIKPEDLLTKNMAIVGIPDAFWFRTTTDRELQFTQPGQQDRNTEGLKLTNRNWIFVTVVIDFPETKIYLNADLVSEFNWIGGLKSWKQQLVIGKDNWKDNFHGSMQNIQIFKEAISSQNITTLYQTSPFEQPLINGIVFYHSFDNKHRYFAKNQTEDIQAQDIIFRNDSLKGRIAEFDGNNSFFAFEELPIDNAVTVSVWVKQNMFDRSFGAVAAFGHAYAIRINGGGTLLFTIPQRADVLELNAKLTPGKWHHIAVSYKETLGVTFYIDGEKKGFSTVEEFQDVTKELQIGTNLWNDFFKGQMDDLIIWNRLLSDQQIKNIYSTKSNFWSKNLKVRQSKAWLYIAVVAFLLLIFLLYIMQWFFPQKETAITEQKQEGVLTEEFKKVIFDNLSDSNYSVAQFAFSMHMSKTKLYNEVKSTTGKSPKEFIREIRLIRASQLLEETKLPITEIIFETGFESRAYFNKCFKQKYNATPSDYRKSTL